MKKIDSNVKRISESFLTHFLTFKFARECVSVLKKMDIHSSETSFAYHFLISNALELYGKSFMCLRWNKEDDFDKEEITKRAFVFGHDLDRIYHYQGVGKEFLSVAGIKNVTLKNPKKYNISQYFFKFHMIDNSDVYIFHTESLRYGVLTKKRNDFLPPPAKNLLDLCESVEKATIKEGEKFFRQI